MEIRGFVAERRVSVEEIHRLWFEYSSFKPDSLGFVVDNSRVYGLGYARVVYGHTGYLWLCIDYTLPVSHQKQALYILLSWARHKLLRKRVFIVKISCGYEYSRLYNLVASLIGTCTSVVDYTLMEYSVLEQKTLYHRVGDSKITIRRGGYRDIPGVVNVYNEAFKRYNWFTEWSVDDAYKWYSSRDIQLYIAVDKNSGEIIGFIDGEKRIGFDGRVYGYVYTLAVHPSRQGQGIGGKLLRYFLDVLSRDGVREVYLDAIAGLEDYYVRHGFRIKRRYRLLVVPVAYLPRYTPCIIEYM